MQTQKQYREMVEPIPPGKTAVISGSGSTGVLVENRTLTLSSYGIARYETTWELWNEVYRWAQSQGYRIANPGREGHGNIGTGDPAKGWTEAQRITRPATGMTWRDAVVWCNAYSEMSGLDPVYYAREGGPVLKESLNTMTHPPTTAADQPFVKPGANGFRLPTEAEWEFAARGGGAQGRDQNAAGWNYEYPGGDGINTVAWYLDNSYKLGSNNIDYGAHPVGSKTGGDYEGAGNFPAKVSVASSANRLGLYDMVGNVSEYCWDWYGAITADTPLDGPGMGTFAHRVMRGGGWSSYAEDCTVTSRNYTRPWVGSGYVGFRIARSL
jgi:formylglycine-generating enzyme required for sulfatase activity